VFLAAKRVDEGSRHGLVEDICDGDVDLRRLVNRLLDADSEGTALIFDEPVFKRPLSHDVDEISAPKRLGPYRVLRSLGSGSVGDVYLADREGEDSPPVAIKVLRPGSFARTELATARFEIERLALSRLSHPNIARILKSGTTDQDHAFIVMEYVPGQRIDEYCRVHRLSRRSRLTLFLQLCDALQHAHQQGVIHRDLKPANILVVDEPWPMVKVVDFGIAKIIGDPGRRSETLTEQGQLLGTLAYMSPEQLHPSRGDADARCDVYALGIILYQLLTDRMPFDEDDELALRARAALGLASIKPMHELPRAARGDLETIVSKALNPDPDRRYATPTHLAEDVRRHLCGDPVLARGPSAWYRISKVAARHPVLFTAGAVLLIALNLIVLSNMLWRVEVERERRVARDSVLHLMDNALDQIRHVSGAVESRRQMAESLIAQTDRLLQFRPRDIELLECRARLLDELGDLAMLSGNTAEVERLRHEVLSIREGLSSRGPQTVERKRRLAEAIVKVGDLLPSDTSAVDAKLIHYHRAKEIHLELYRDFPTHLGVIDDLCWSYARISHCLAKQGKPATAQVYRQLRLALAMRLLALSPDRALSHHNAAWAHSAMAEHSDDEDTILSETYLALSHAREAVSREPDRIAFRETLLTALTARSHAMFQYNGVEDARPLIFEVVNETERLAVMNPENPIAAHWQYSRRLWGAHLLANGLQYGDSWRLAAQALRLLNMDENIRAQTSESPDDLSCQAVVLIELAAQRGGVPAHWRGGLNPNVVPPLPPSWPNPREDEFWPTDEVDRPGDDGPVAKRWEDNPAGRQEFPVSTGRP
jgi:serine/threonine protein kinase